MSTHEMVFAEIPIDGMESFGAQFFKNDEWDLRHLDSFAFQYFLAPEWLVTVVVLFSCHCFTHSFGTDPRPRSDIPLDELFDDGRERRVLCVERYLVSRRLLRCIVLTLNNRRIIVADERRPNFVTVEPILEHERSTWYAVFFEVVKDKLRAARLTLRVQSAYTLDQGLTKRQSRAKKVRLETILRAAMEGRAIRS